VKQQHSKKRDVYDNNLTNPSKSAKTSVWFKWKNTPTDKSTDTTHVFNPTFD